MARTTSKGGRPTLYTHELAREICDTLASSSQGLTALCKSHEHWPDRANVFRWLIKYPEFRDMYAECKKMQVESLVDEILAIADDSSQDNETRYTESGESYIACNAEWMNRARLRIDTRKWLAAKLAPRIYGENSLTKNESQNDDFINKNRDKL